MSSIAEVRLKGNLADNPEIKRTQKGDDVFVIANLKVIVNRRYMDKETGEVIDTPHGFYVTAFGKTAEYIESRGKKGSWVDLEGDLYQDRYTDEKTGETKYPMRIKLNTRRSRISFLDKPESQEVAEDIPFEDGEAA